MQKLVKLASTTTYVIATIASNVISRNEIMNIQTRPILQTLISFGSLFLVLIPLKTKKNPVSVYLLSIISIFFFLIYNFLSYASLNINSVDVLILGQLRFPQIYLLQILILKKSVNYVKMAGIAFILLASYRILINTEFSTISRLVMAYFCDSMSYFVLDAFIAKKIVCKVNFLRTGLMMIAIACFCYLIYKPESWDVNTMFICTGLLGSITLGCIFAISFLFDVVTALILRLICKAGADLFSDIYRNGFVEKTRVFEYLLSLFGLLLFEFGKNKEKIGSDSHKNIEEDKHEIGMDENTVECK